tara:strand:- start:1980 stop:2870 length:891 start_codon:yes stop_codon:yes gene_type:complete
MNKSSKHVDLLDEDKPLAGQKFVCLSFVSPEKIIKQKEMFMFEKFIEQWDFSKSMEKFNQFLNFISYKYSLEFDSLTQDLEEFTKEEKDNLFFTCLPDEYKSYIDAHEDKLDEEFNREHEFKTSTRGIKVRGSFPSQEEAELRCKMLRELDPNHDVYVGPVGMWMPFHPEAYKTGRVEYLEQELNELMNEKDKNEKNAKQEFDKRVRDAKEKAMNDNRKKAEETGVKLTQTINKDGNLVSTNNLNTSELALLENAETSNRKISVSDIRKELFEGDNVIVDKNTDHGLTNLNINDDN